MYHWSGIFEFHNVRKSNISKYFTISKQYSEKDFVLKKKDILFKIPLGKMTEFFYKTGN